MNQFKVSICVPTYNGIDYLPQLLESLVPQLRDGVEIVLCDDCSTDGTYALSQKYVEKFPFISLYKNTHNLGMDRNFSQAAKLAKGEYVWFSSQDDIFKEGTINKFFEIIENNKDIDFIYFNYRFWNDDLTKELDPPLLSFRDDRVYQNEKEYFAEIDRIPTFLPSIIMRQKFWEITPLEIFYDTHYVQVGVWLYNFINAKTVIVGNPDFIVCRIPDDSWKLNSGQMLFEIFSGNLEVYNTVFKSNKNPIPEELFYEKKNHFIKYLPDRMVNFTGMGFRRNQLLDKRMSELFKDDPTYLKIFIKITYLMPPWFYLALNRIVSIRSTQKILKYLHKVYLSFYNKITGN